MMRHNDCNVAEFVWIVAEALLVQRGRYAFGGGDIRKLERFIRYIL